VPTPRLEPRNVASIVGTPTKEVQAQAARLPRPVVLFLPLTLMATMTSDKDRRILSIQETDETVRKLLTVAEVCLWHHDGVPTKALAERVGHADAAITLNLYSHVLDPGEMP
jgi:hypothetical protein